MADSKRRLAAILAADVAGYSRLMAADERSTLGMLNAARAVFRDRTAKRDGRVIDTAGDSVLAVFDSVVQAVECASEVQSELREGAQETPEDRRMAFRIGINLGDVIEQADGTIYGDGVNIAARLESIAEPGGIVLSGTAFDQIDGKVDIGFGFLGEKNVKNIAKPVRAYRAGLGVNQPRTKQPHAAPASKRPSIAVLAFENLSGDTEQEYFADGIAEDLITELSGLRWLQVTARNSSFSYKGQSPDIRSVGRELGVGYVVEGSVRKGGNRVRITAQLIDTATGNHMWAQRYDRELSDIFAIQDEITATLAATLDTEVSDFERDRSRQKRPDDLNAWDSYQRGMWHLWQMGVENLEEARRLFERAIDLDPVLARAYAGIGHSCFIQAANYSSAPSLSLLDDATRYAGQAVMLDDKDPMAHATLGRVHAFKGQYDAAIEETKIALDLNPSSALAHYVLGVAVWWRDQLPEALEELDIAIRLSPRDPHNWVTTHMRAFVHLSLGNYEAAVEDAKRASKHPVAGFWPQATLTASLAHLGFTAEAERAHAQLMKMRPDFTPRAAIEVYSPMNYETLLPHCRAWIEGLNKAGRHRSQDVSSKP